MSWLEESSLWHVGMESVGMCAEQLWLFRDLTCAKWKRLDLAFGIKASSAFSHSKVQTNTQILNIEVSKSAGLKNWNIAFFFFFLSILRREDMLSSWHYSMAKIKKDLSKSFCTMLHEGGLQLQLCSGVCTWTGVWGLTGTLNNKVKGANIAPLIWHYCRYFAMVSWISVDSINIHTTAYAWAFNAPRYAVWLPVAAPVRSLQVLLCICQPHVDPLDATGHIEWKSLSVGSRRKTYWLYWLDHCWLYLNTTRSRTCWVDVANSRRLLTKTFSCCLRTLVWLAPTSL